MNKNFLSRSVEMADRAVRFYDESCAGCMRRIFAIFFVAASAFVSRARCEFDVNVWCCRYGVGAAHSKISNLTRLSYLSKFPNYDRIQAAWQRRFCGLGSCEMECQMIVLKATQDKFLGVLQSVAGIAERRHTLPVLANVLIRKVGMSLCDQIKQVDSFNLNQTAALAMQIFRPEGRVLRVSGRGSSGFFSPGLRPVSNRSTTASLRLAGFFSASKTNLRNAP